MLHKNRRVFLSVQRREGIINGGPFFYHGVYLIQTNPSGAMEGNGNGEGDQIDVTLVFGVRKDDSLSINAKFVYAIENEMR